MAEVGPMKIRCNPDVAGADLDGELVLLDTRTGVYYGLNRIGAEVWRLLVQDRPVEAIIGHLLENYEVEAEQARRDVVRFIDGLVACGLVRFEGPDGGQGR